MKYQNLMLPNELYGSVWGAYLHHSDVGIYNMSGLEEYLLTILEPDEKDNLPCILADGTFNNSAVVMTTKLYEGATLDERSLYTHLAFIWQQIELQYGSFFNLFLILLE